MISGIMLRPAAAVAAIFMTGISLVAQAPKAPMFEVDPNWPDYKQNLADIWNNELDGLASIASYFRDAGWKPNVAWGIRVRTPANLDRAALVSRTTAPRCPQVYRRHSRWLTMREWRALGVAPVGRSLPDSEMATLIEPDGPDSTAFLATSNYRVILDYNCSNFYAISVGVLADAIAGR